MNKYKNKPSLRFQRLRPNAGAGAVLDAHLRPLSVYMYMYIYVYICIYTSICIHIKKIKICK